MLRKGKTWVLLTLLWGSISAAHAGSPFVGRWSGGWHDTALGQMGTLHFTVRPNGAFAGHLQNNSGSLNGSWTGSISDQGSIQADYAYTSGDKAGAGSTSFRAVGTLHRNDAGHLVGRLAFVRGEQPFDYADFDLVRARPMRPLSYHVAGIRAVGIGQRQRRHFPRRFRLLPSRRGQTRWCFMILTT